MNSRDKGKRAEREAACVLSELLHDEVRRSQQYAGGVESADLTGGPSDVHWEVKHQERMRLYEWMDQATRDCGTNVPLVMHRQNRKPWLLTLKVSDLLRMSLIISTWVAEEKNSGSYSVRGGSR